jgi:hypothetical protein
MSAISQNSLKKCRVLWLTALILALSASASSVRAQDENDASAPATTFTPYAEVQYSTLTGSSNGITATLLPVVTSSGLVYKDVTLGFAVNSSGNITLAPGYPKAVNSPTNLTADFKPGNYIGPSSVLNGKALITVSGPGVTTGGATEWSLQASPGAAVCTYPSSATWYVGPITSNPIYSRLKAAGITSAAYSYGILGGEVCYGYWEDGAIIGVSQTGNTITVVSFSYAGSYDFSTPRDQITYTLKSSAAATVAASPTSAQTADNPTLLADEASTLNATATPTAEFQDSTLTGSGDVINATMLPVVTSTGTVYKNLTLQFNIDSSGGITVAAGFPHLVPAPTPQITSFRAGTYVGPSTVLNDLALITVSGPGVTTGGATEWSLQASPGAAVCTYPSSATWYVGPVTSNPLYSRLKAKGITSAAYSYGILGGEVCYGYWEDGTLIGVSQTGNTITVVSFSYAGSYDFSTPRDQITYTLK